MKQKDITNAPLTILLSIDGRMYVTAFDKEEFEAVSHIVKSAIKNIIPTEATQSGLNKLLRGENL